MNTINENSRLSKARRALFGTPNVRTFCILTANNPIYAHDENDKGTMSPEQNKELNDELVSMLKTRGFRFFKALGKFGNDNENSFIIYNISLDYCMFLGKYFDQRSFIYGKFIPENKQVEFSYYEKLKSERDNVSDRYKQYKLVETITRKNELSTDTPDNYTAIGRNFKFNIPFEIFNEGCNEIDRLVTTRRNNYPEYDELYEGMLTKSIKDGSSREQRFARAFLYGERFTQLL